MSNIGFCCGQYAMKEEEEEEQEEQEEEEPYLPCQVMFGGGTHVSA